MKKIKQSLLPLGVMVLGAVAAFASHSSKTAVLADEAGYVTLDLTKPCEILVECSNTGSIACTAEVNGVTHNAYGKWSINDVDCEKPLFQRMN
ncbi:hypothetical protein H1R17_01485 [Flavobacterium sp. xlx-214]|uniref:DUF6520 family protein n=1 Tax=unclassified Flavobacterium TaxID=196869 RepID=UPI0013D7E776|nr:MULTISPECIES: DUF6520 family protein [unclassified Flavobacterium]MBA5792693.1 hypothetical protein [Flavobacterium sp. xlx-221]QMI83838.1 hypothetical protein H1R17_01485 [Flavobacterium sp. xlx-214]